MKVPTPYPVYVVDDDRLIRALILAVCEEQGYDARGFESGEQFLSVLGELEPGCIILDMRMPRKSGLGVQEELAARGSLMPVVAITGHGDVDMAVRSMKLGALEFLEKPFSNAVLLEAVALAFRQLDSAGTPPLKDQDCGT